MNDLLVLARSDDLPFIFNRFYCADCTRSHDQGGTGSGLTIVQNIVQEHADKIGVENVPGQRTTFTLRFPIVRDVD